MKPNRIIVFIAIAAMALSLFCIPCHAQDKCDKPFEIDLPAVGKDVMRVCEQQPEFPGGMRALMDYLKKEIRYPKKCSASGIEGRAFVRFIVDKNGKIKKVELFKSSGNQLLDKEAIRVVKKMPRWNPGKNKGEAVKMLCQKLDVAIENAVACGDAANDLAMLKAAGIGVAMINGSDEVKAVADYITTRDNNHDGVAEAADKFFWEAAED